jgi:hypothetical protein
MTMAPQMDVPDGLYDDPVRAFLHKLHGGRCSRMVPPRMMDVRGSATFRERACQQTPTLHEVG